MEWFKDWFNSPYYHILYGKRDENEAALFVQNLAQHLKVPVPANVLDACCGKGRHVMQWAKLGYNTLGFDYSKNSIEEANKQKTELVTFEEHDIRRCIGANRFDITGCFFTSLGYFNTVHENNAAFNNLAISVKNNGYLIIDFLNKQYSLNQLVPKETIYKGDIKFEITRQFLNNKFIKRTVFFAEDKENIFVEKVYAYGLQDFEKMFQLQGFKIINIFGDYNLSNFDVNNSTRLILIGQKIC
jgi:SAM-dependent methyltransferase